MHEPKFRIVLLEEAKDFLDTLPEKTRSKILYNLWKARITLDKDLFKKLQDDIWEFRTTYNKIHYRLFAFWDKTNSANTLVIATHGLTKKTNKIPPSELEHANTLLKQYFESKNKK